jgi:hypothetical protein
MRHSLDRIGGFEVRKSARRSSQGEDTGQIPMGSHAAGNAM